MLVWKKKTIALAIALLLTVGAIIPNIKNNSVADTGNYYYNPASVQDVMADFGIVAFESYQLNSHVHSNFLTDVVSGEKDTFTRDTYGLSQVASFNTFINYSDKVFKIV